MITTYPGGKGGEGVAQAIINQMPPHTLYVEGCVGSGAILRMKKPARSSIAIDRDPEVIAHLEGHRLVPDGTTCICGDVMEWLETNPLSAGALVYLDPPYLLETRSSKKKIYRYEMTTRQEHARLLGIIQQLNCMVIISGYRSELYASELAHWRTATYQTTNRAGKPTTEWLWMNYPEPVELHDYRYLGKNFREREKIKRRKSRWKARLARMNQLERYAMFNALDEWRSGTAE